MTTIVLNYEPDEFDARDYKITYSPPLFHSNVNVGSSKKTPTPRTPPSILDWSPLFGFLYNQGSIGCCTACSTNSVFSFMSKSYTWVPSPLFTYYGSRSYEGTTQSDRGSSLRNSIKSLVNNGVCANFVWPMTRSFRERPSQTAYDVAKNHKVTQYASVQLSVDQFLFALQTGHIIAFGIPVYTSFLNATNGTIPMPSPNRGDRIEGYHAIVCVGYNQITRRFKFRNSWGTLWGQNGYGTLPYDMMPYFFDAWTILSTSTSNIPSNVAIERPGR